MRSMPILVVHIKRYSSRPCVTGRTLHASNLWSEIQWIIQISLHSPYGHVGRYSFRYNASNLFVLNNVYPLYGSCATKQHLFNYKSYFIFHFVVVVRLSEKEAMGVRQFPLERIVINLVSSYTNLVMSLDFGMSTRGQIAKTTW